MITIEIPRVPASPNLLRSKHWRVRLRETKLWREEIGYAVMQIKPSPHAIAKAKVAIDRRSKGIMDTDNLYGCVKPVIDGLRHAGVLVDDSPEHIELTSILLHILERQQIPVHQWTSMTSEGLRTLWLKQISS